MAVFHDRLERQWLVDVTPASMKRVHESTGIDLGLIDDEMTTIRQAFRNPMTVVDVLCCLVRPQLQERGLTEEDFGESLAGDHYEAAERALRQAITDFFPSRQRNLLTKFWQKTDQLQEALAAQADATLEAMDTEDLLSQLTGTGSASSTPPSPASTPGTTR